MDMYKQDLVLTYLEGLICHETQPTSQPTISYDDKHYNKHTFLIWVIMVCLI